MRYNHDNVKQHYKMYKAGKFWLFTTLSLISIGLVSHQKVVQADSVSNNQTEENTGSSSRDLISISYQSSTASTTDGISDRIVNDSANLPVSSFVSDGVLYNVSSDGEVYIAQDPDVIASLSADNSSINDSDDWTKNSSVSGATYTSAVNSANSASASFDSDNSSILSSFYSATGLPSGGDSSLSNNNILTSSQADSLASSEDVSIASSKVAESSALTSMSISDSEFASENGFSYVPSSAISVSSSNNDSYDISLIAEGSFEASSIASSEAVANSIATSIAESNSIASSEAVANSIVTSIAESNSIVSSEAVATSIATSIAESNSIVSSEVVANSIATSIAESNSIASSEAVANSIAESNSIASSEAVANSIAESNSIASSEVVVNSIAESNSIASSEAVANSIATSIVESNSIASSEAVANSIATSIVELNSIGSSDAVINISSSSSIVASAISKRADYRITRSLIVTRGHRHYLLPANHRVSVRLVSKRFLANSKWRIYFNYHNRLYHVSVSNWKRIFKSLD